jgi:hypothetical protein
MSERNGFGELVGAYEAAEILKIGSPNFAHLRRRAKDFPEPVAELRCGPIWRTDDVLHFKANYRPRMGRPPKVRTDASV